jgi:hypothetical protein
MGPFEAGGGGDWRDIRYRDPRGTSNLAKVIDSGARWVRLWVRWDVAMPARDQFETAGYLAALDDQIRVCRENGIGVVLVSWRFPRWANYTEDVDPNTYARQDRVRADGSQLKDLEYGIPAAELGTDRAWGQWVHHLISRYRHNGCGVILEVMNEPNFQMWPQRDQDGDLMIGQKVAEMMHTAAVVSSWHGHAMPIAAPATSDFRRSSTRYETYFSDFVAALKQALTGMNFRGMPTYIWTHHNYKDIEDQNSIGVAQTRNMLVGFWRGWSATSSDGSNPAVWITEGGARRHIVGTYEAQATRVGSAWNRMVSQAGAVMFTNYLLHSVPDPFDQGLRHPLPDDGIRPVWNTFKGWPGNP